MLSQYTSYQVNRISFQNYIFTGGILQRSELVTEKPLSDMFPRNKWNVKWKSTIGVNPQVKFVCAQQKFF